MQQLTAAPRTAFTAAQVTSLLTASSVTVDYGCELLDLTNTVVADISGDLASGSVSRDCYADVHGTCTLSLSRPLAWGRDRVRPYQILSVGPLSARFNLGVFVLTTPARAVKETPVTYSVTGFDLLHLLQSPVGDTYAVQAGTTYLAAVRGVLAASGAGGTLRMDGTGQATALPADMVWCLSDTYSTTWLRVIDDLLAAIAYRGMWVDQDGVFRSEPYVNPATRGAEWAFDVTDQRTNIVGEDRTETNDVWNVPNWWRFVRKVSTSQPMEGAGIYTVTNTFNGPASMNSVGRTVKAPTLYLDAADQATLVAQGNQIVATSRAVSHLISLKTGPFPLAGHFDMSTVNDPALGPALRVQARSWTLPLDGADMDWVYEVIT